MKQMRLSKELQDKIDQLKRIDKRIEDNYRIYFKRKSGSSEEEQGEEGEEEYDEITNDWRKLNENILGDIPAYMNIAKSEAELSKINTLRRETQRIKDKIESKIDKEDKQRYSLNSKANLWVKQVKKSALRPQKKTDIKQYPEIEYEQIIDEQNVKPNSGIFESLEAVGKDKIQKRKQQLQTNQLRNKKQKKKGRIQQQYYQHMLFYALILLLLIIFILTQFNINIGTHFHTFLVDL